jgi:hypothetical protein
MRPSGVLKEILFSAPPSVRYANSVEGGRGARVVLDHDKTSGRPFLMCAGAKL